MENLGKEAMKTIKRALAGVLACSGLLFAGAALAVGDSPGGPRVNQINLQTPVTPIAEELFSLHMLMLLLCLLIFVGVFSVMFYSIFAHRRSKGYKAAHFHESTTVEIIWTIVPFIIVVLMALPATRTVVAMKDTSNADLTVKVTGYQWKWGYDYVKGPGEGISFLSTLSTPRSEVNNRAPITDTYLQEVDNPLVVPVDRKVRIITTANDVVHSWFVPAFGVKQDAIPGFLRDTWFKATKVGTYRGFCTELCGKEHAFMPVVVEVLSDDDYAKWVDTQKKKMAAGADDPNRTYTLAELKERGEKVYMANCAVCHQPTGKGAGAFPALDGSKIVNGPIAEHVSLVLKGKNAMPSWAPTLSDVEIASVITFERNAWDNHTNDILQPRQVADARNGKLPEGGNHLAEGAGAAAASDTQAASAAPDASAAQNTASLPASIYFDTGKSTLPADAQAAIQAAADYAKAHPDAKFALSGYTDATGSADANAELAKRRAQAVRDALKAAGIAEDRIILKKPETITGGSDAKEARRVEIGPAA
ncbi:cytochrome c oxidase subunit II [Paraburkholderia caballeronis]|uniref:Cytochrome c oxidase subunit 2 n=1 Tax=Paraburkholderia caballeronis TaxID=416943 RepID=A0A1H7HVX2_9BURK|nr:cytochrome c oxidase subunit II [Paraburkholderia caballeronis]PXW29364.1 cytochrome c oxidase subunit 2 [Paraburkholderia caballeronis]PXX04623.1 cytochrome c oxidase subunit 2 [Paraburkholderia caballeronis]RAK05684.1 cytochrome c oxidase subunit 2 [Paraburkholderia caballeronis]TDV18463.1 cytochrome c oxidase subunit 2 [Paraburkholderia caballeronis]TDV19999.1 cytochrome c oxidase subunit 2 [Paraburkholderia caballeronis]